MPRVKGGTVTRRRRKRVLKLAKGYYGSKHALFKTAKQQVMKSGQYAYRDRKQRKRNFRKLWIARINAAARMNDISYSRLMHGLREAGIEVNRKMLADLAVNDEQGFANLVTKAKEALK
ncbi:large subunit ribosomal protein L20 [Salinibacillus kushneri]|uniref:Large ribosomal subunit protein bL20 n=1 Tax=Salinibacillus kushneri TaxID=237682 RepID=A0A1I0H4X9_9BACI|nr:50S ribosomal protein L20 [Salinibacillus kushneri]SET78691.1 large subunit ribosomal protein L20 [Salinibacillus kushneri]